MQTVNWYMIQGRRFGAAGAWPIPGTSVLDAIAAARRFGLTGALAIVAADYGCAADAWRA